MKERKRGAPEGAAGRDELCETEKDESQEITDDDERAPRRKCRTKAREGGLNREVSPEGRERKRAENAHPGLTEESQDKQRACRKGDAMKTESSKKNDMESWQMERASSVRVATRADLQALFAIQRKSHIITTINGRKADGHAVLNVRHCHCKLAHKLSILDVNI